MHSLLSPVTAFISDHQAWAGPLLVNEREQAITGFAHYDSPYAQMELGDAKMELHFQDLLVRLDFS